MSEYKATIQWRDNGPEFVKGKYSREHVWKFDGGLTIPASSSPSVVRPPYSNPANVDPEEAFVASIASCHMMTFLYVAQLGGFHVTAYEDQAVGVMARNEKGAMWVSKVTLNPQITYGGDKTPSPEELSNLHHKAHEQCFIANSVKTEVIVSGVH
jgi:organic hydroperoxide reductase OsmC/OhrA